MEDQLLLAIEEEDYRFVLLYISCKLIRVSMSWHEILQIQVALVLISDT